MAASDFQITGNNDKALFTLKLHRGDGMCLVAMNWKRKAAKGLRRLRDRIQGAGRRRLLPAEEPRRVPDQDGEVNPLQLSTRLSPIQKFRWVHFPRNAELEGEFLYRVTPMFMDAEGRLSHGDPQEAAIELRRETYPGKLNVTFTRGFVSSQAFVDRYEKPARSIRCFRPRPIRD